MPPTSARTEPSSAPYAAWCRRIREGDTRAFELLFRDSHPGLLRFAYSLAESTAAADDLVQEAFVRLWERRERLDPSRSIRALLFQMVRNRALNRIRDRATRQDKLTDLAAHAPPPTPSPHAQLEAASDGERLRAWVEELPERQREAIHLTRYQSLTHDEAAEVMGVSPRTVNNHLVRALRTLRQRYDATSDPE